MFGVFILDLLWKLIWFWFCELCNCFSPHPTPCRRNWEVKRKKEGNKDGSRGNDTLAHKGRKIPFHLTKGDCTTYKGIGGKSGCFMCVFLHTSALWEAWGCLLQRQPPSFSFRQTKLELLAHFLGVDRDSSGHRSHVHMSGKVGILGKRLLLSFRLHTWLSSPKTDYRFLRMASKGLQTWA